MENRNNMIPEEELKNVSGGTGNGYAPYFNGDLVWCHVGNTSRGGSINQVGRVICYAEDEEGFAFNVELGGINTNTKELYFTGETRLFRTNQLSPYNG